MNKFPVLHIGAIVLGIGAIVFIISRYEHHDFQSYKDKNEGPSGVVRPQVGLAKQKHPKTYQVWGGAYAPVYPLSRGL